MKLLLIVMSAIFLASCGATQSVPGEKKDRGYCFKADGLSKMRCYPTSDECWGKQSLISDQHPWATITYSCQRTLF